jgi:integrase
VRWISYTKQLRPRAQIEYYHLPRLFFQLPSSFFFRKSIVFCVRYLSVYFPGRVGRPATGTKRPHDPTIPVTTLNTVWKNVKERAGVIGRFHDARHTFITDLCEAGNGDQTIMELAGHVSPQMPETLYPHSNGGQTQGTDDTTED